MTPNEIRRLRSNCLVPTLESPQTVSKRFAARLKLFGRLPAIVSYGLVYLSGWKIART